MSSTVPRFSPLSTEPKSLFHSIQISFPAPVILDFEFSIHLQDLEPSSQHVIDCSWKELP